MLLKTGLSATEEHHLAGIMYNFLHLDIERCPCVFILFTEDNNTILSADYKILVMSGYYRPTAVTDG